MGGEGSADPPLEVMVDVFGGAVPPPPGRWGGRGQGASPVGGLRRGFWEFGGWIEAGAPGQRSAHHTPREAETERGTIGGKGVDRLI